jgi:tRNA1Val (adenine37-N6)-methyltransferase
MGRNNYFQFKQFKIIQEKSAMKVGTDGVLLGAWANVENAKNILDIGTGTGLIAIMLAQRCKAQITAVEIEKDAAREAIQNIANSSWKKLIEVENISFQEFVQNTSRKYDLIVSNPPFFVNSWKKKTVAATIARHTDTLSFAELIDGVVKLLKSEGRFSVVLPLDASDEFIRKANSRGLHLNIQTLVKPKSNKAANRCLLTFSNIEHPLTKDELIIHNNEETDYSSAYKSLTKDFYLKF